MQANGAPQYLRDGPGVSEAPATDGRLLRGQRTRRRVAEALVELLHDGDQDPTSKAIAERAGVSLRLVFHHFSDIDDLYRTVATLQLERHWGDLPCFSSRLAVATRIERTVRHRSVLYEEISPVRRAAIRRAPSSPGVTDLLAHTDELLRENLSATFAPELEGRSETERHDTLAALDAASSWETWDRMRHRSDLNVTTTRRVVTRTMSALLTPGTPPPPSR
jgi:AcrR family transcriptional regulator